MLRYACVVIFALASSVGALVPQKAWKPRATVATTRAGFLQVPVAAALALVAIPNNAEAATLPPNLKMVGTYTDPSHPEGFRSLTVSGSSVTVEGSDTGPRSKGVEWTLKGTVDGSSVFLDFTPKGFAKVLEAKFDGSGLVFPDGNRWPQSA